jgi:hypothetical protein
MSLPPIATSLLQLGTLHLPNAQALGPALAGRAGLSPAAQSLLASSSDPSSFVKGLASRGMNSDAVSALAHGMSEQRGVQWAAASARQVAPQLPPHEVEALEATETYVKQGGSQQQLASAVAKAGPSGPGSWAAQAALWSHQGASMPAMGALPAQAASLPAGAALPAQAASLPVGAALPVQAASLPAGLPLPSQAASLPAAATLPAQPLAPKAIEGSVRLSAAVKAGSLTLPQVPPAPTLPQVTEPALTAPQLEQLAAPVAPVVPGAPQLAAMNDALAPFVQLGMKIAAGTGGLV